MNCRHCGKILENCFLDLGTAPPSNAYLNATMLNGPEVHFPLKVLVCESCWLVQTEDFTSANALFTDEYAYFSSTSKSWLLHAERYVQQIIQRLELDQDSFVIEVASNDGYLLKNFLSRGISCLGIEPTKSTAEVAIGFGIPCIGEFFGEELGRRLSSEGKQADLIIGNNVYAHVPDINDFTAGLKLALKPGGTVTLEFPHLMQLIDQTQFDTVYHEHFSYLSLSAVRQVFQKAGLRVFDVDELPTHGGSLRIYGCHHDDPRGDQVRVADLLETELSFGLQQIETYQGFQPRVERLVFDLLSFLLEQKRNSKTVMAYGAAAKGNTLLNYAGVRPNLLSCVFDAAPSKQRLFMPGSHIPILPPEKLVEARPDYLLILPWNIADEVKEQNAELAKSGTTFVTAVPELRLL